MRFLREATKRLSICYVFGLAIFLGPSLGQIRVKNESGCKLKEYVTVGILDGRLLCQNGLINRLNSIRYHIVEIGTHIDLSSASNLGDILSESSGLKIEEDKTDPNLIIVFISNRAGVDLSGSVGKFLQKDDAQIKALIDIQNDIKKFQIAASDDSLNVMNLSRRDVLHDKQGQIIYIDSIVLNDSVKAYSADSDVLERFMSALGLSFGALQRER